MIDPTRSPWDVVISHLVGSMDPNDKLTAGYGAEGFIPADTIIPYTVQFENQPSATAPAQRVIITDVLSENLDLDTFELTEIGFASHTIIVPPGLSAYHTRVDLAPEGHNCVVDITVTLDHQTRVLNAEFIALDPATGWMPEDVMTGLLYPNDETGRGEGYISCLIKPVSDLPNTTVIKNEATIVFDYNDAIDTPEVQNTLDAIPPSSEVLPLPGVSATPDFQVDWIGEDNEKGSGIARFDIYVQDNGGPWTLWLSNTTQTLDIFYGQFLHTYGFYSIAMDNVGNREEPPSEPDATTHLDVTGLYWNLY